MNSIREWISIKMVKSPRFIVLIGVLGANVIFIGVAAFIITCLMPDSAGNGGFGSSIFNTIMMYLGIGGIEMVIDEINEADMFLVLFSIIIVVIGMVFFTYALIGYMSDFIANFIAEADSSARKLRISDHTVILNWNTRAAELIRAVHYASPENNKTVLLGYFRSNGGMILFEGDLSKINISLTVNDKLIVFSNH